MARICWLVCILHFLSACKSTSTPSSLAAAKAPLELVAASTPPQKLQEVSDAPLPSCQNLKAQCPDEERKLPYQCVAYRLAGELLWKESRVYAWGNSLCQARQSLLIQACAQKMEPAQLSEIHCGPDSTSGACPVIGKNCPSQGKATRCVASRYKNQEIPWSERPVVWASNECKARDMLLQSACQQGLDPNSLGDIACEADSNPGMCPPKAAACPEAGGVPSTCQVSTVGDITLKKPWVATGATACEAQYRLKELACRFADAAKKLTPDQLGSMECRSLIEQPR